MRSASARQRTDGGDVNHKDELKYSITYYVDELRKGTAEGVLQKVWPPLSTGVENEEITVTEDTLLTDKDGKCLVWFLPKLFSEERQVNAT